MTMTTMPEATETKTTTNLPIRRIPLDALRESEWNPRQHFPEREMQELVESMRSSGFREWLPILVRPLAGFDDLYEIGAGHRRSRAARQAGITEVPCIVREMTDEEFLDVLNFDNSGREDVHPLHEAAGWQQWMEKTGKGVLDIAAKIGQSKEYVYQRLKYASLVPEAKAAFLDNSITAGHAILIARLQAKDQHRALKFMEPPKWDPTQKKGVRDLAWFVQRDIHTDMQKAAFDIDSVDLLPSAGACTNCPKRTKNAPDMLLPVEQADNPDKDECTDPSCFAAKLDAHLVRIKEKLEAKGDKPIDVSSQYAKTKKGVLSRSDYEQVSATTKGAQVAVVADGEQAGSVIHIRKRNTSSPSSSSRVDYEAQRKAEEEKRKARVERELPVRKAILAAIHPKVTALSRVDIEALLLFALDCSRLDGASELCALYGIKFQKFQEEKALTAALPKMSDVEIFQMAVELPLVVDLDEYAIGQNKPAELLSAAAKRYKVDAVKIRRQLEEAAKAQEGDREVGKPSTGSAAAATPAKGKKTPAKKKAAATPKSAKNKKAGKAK